jgi:Kef-type K+ transport system membrane component KefB
MGHSLELTDFLKILVVILGTAKLFGLLAQRIGQPAILGELVGGALLGKSALGLVDPSIEVLHLLSELGIIILLFSIGLETNLASLLKVGRASLAVATVGVVLPFLLGVGVCWILGQDRLVSIVCGAALTATSVGITVRVLSELGHLNDPESQIVLGAAIIDDIVGLVILSVVATLATGGSVTGVGIARISLLAGGFLVVTIVVGRPLLRGLFRLTRKIKPAGSTTIYALLLALGLAWLADKAGSAVIIGAFAAGVLLVDSPRHHEIELGVTRLGHFFVPLFFVCVGAAVDLSALNPLDPARRSTLVFAGLLTVAAVLGKFAAGYAPFWLKARKSLIGVAMIPRGEVGLIFAQMGRSSGVLGEDLFAALTLVVMITTFLAPILLRLIAHPTGPPDEVGIEDLVNTA